MFDVAAEEEAPAPGGGNATRSRSKRTRQQQPPAEAGQPQQEQEDVSSYLPILNWIVFFFVIQSVVGSLVAKFSPTENNNVPKAPSSLSNNDIFDGDIVSNGEIDAAVDATGRQKRKPLGATDKSNYDKDMRINMNTRNKNMKRPKPSCIWELGTVMDLDVLITDSPLVPNGWPSLTTPIDDDDDLANDKPSKKGGNVLASWQQEGLVLGGVSDETDKRHAIMSFLSSNADQAMNHRNTTLTIPMTQSVWNNETHVYAYIRLQRRRHFKNGSDSRGKNSKGSRKDDVLVKRMMLTRYRKRKKMRDVKSLINTPSESNNSSSMVDANDSSILTTASLNKTHDQTLLYMKPSLTLQLVEMGPVDFPTRESVPKQFGDHMDWYEGESGGRGGVPRQELYYPILYGSDFWITYVSLREVNGTLKESKLDVTFEPVPVRF